MDLESGLKLLLRQKKNNLQELICECTENQMCQNKSTKAFFPDIPGNAANKPKEVHVTPIITTVLYQERKFCFFPCVVIYF